MTDTMTRRIFLCPDALHARVDRWRRANGVPNWSDAVRRLLAAALDASDARNPLPPDALEALEAYRRDVGAKTLGDALKGLVRTARAAEANLDNGERPPLRLVPPDPPVSVPAPAPPPGWWSQAKRTLSSLVM